MSPLEKYLRYRDLQADIGEDILTGHVDDDRLRTAAKLLGLAVRRGKIVIDEDDLPSLYDFSINDVRRGGKTAIEEHVEGIGGVEKAGGPARRRLLRAMLSAKTSLYREDRADPNAGTVHLTDMLGDGEGVTIYDRGLSLTHHTGVGIFARIIRLPSISMTSGAACLFAPSDLQRALSAYRRLEKGSDRRPEIKRYALFFRLFSKFGLQAGYMNGRTGEMERYEDGRTRPPRRRG